MGDIIDLDAIQLKYISKEKSVVYPTKEQVRDMMTEAIRQALEIASRKARMDYTGLGHSDRPTDISKESILNVINLIK